MSESAPSSTSTSRPWYQRIGPGVITACVVIGPGSIMTSSKTGATYGYSLSWIVVVAVVFMLVYTSLGAKIGVVSQRSMGDLVRERAGRPLAVLLGLGVFFIAAAFQFGNNLGVHSAFEQLLGSSDVTHVAGESSIDWWKFAPVVIFNALSISFVFFAKNLYRVVERLMMGFVGLMLLSFAVNLFFAGPDLAEFARGFMPTPSSIRAVIWPDATATAAGSDPVLVILGLVGTTFVVAASFYQSYLVRQKGWNLEQLKDGLLDVRIGALIMALITLMIMATSAASLRGQALGSVGDVAQQLRPLFGDKGLYLFCLGLFSAAYSSFIVNSMIGGFILSDGLGLGSKPDHVWTRLFTVLVLVTGMSVAIFVVHTGVKPVPAIVAAQAVTVIAAPLMAGTILWLSNRKDIMGEHTNGVVVNIVAGIGFLVLLAIAGSTAFLKVLPAVQGWLSGGAA